MKRIGEFLKSIKNTGFHDGIHHILEKEIASRNMKMLRSISFIGTILLALLAIASVFVPSIHRVMPLYVTIALLSLLIFLLSFVASKPAHILVLLYSFLITTYLFAIGLDMIQKSETAVTACVLLVVLPIMILDQPYRKTICFFVILCLYFVESYCFKQSPKASVEVINGLSFFLIGTYIGYQTDRMSLRNILNQRLLENQRDRDTLTALFNKGAMENKAVEFLSKENVTASIMVIDLDDFKHINDTYGHDAGDYVLSQMGTILLSLFRSGDLVSRFGGDEFIIFLPMMDDRKVLEEKAQAVLDALSFIRLDQDDLFRVNVCIGLACYPTDGGSYDELFKNADTAMYKVKKNGKNGYYFYNE